jgi:carboxypeptidase Taq
MSPSSYKQLEQRFARLGRLRDAQGILHWDRSVMMPAGGAAGRAEQLATLDWSARIDHRSENRQLLDAAESALAGNAPMCAKPH